MPLDQSLANGTTTLILTLDVNANMRHKGPIPYTDGANTLTKAFLRTNQKRWVARPCEIRVKQFLWRKIIRPGPQL